MKYYLLRLNGPRPSFPHDITAEEGALMREHSVYWRGLAARGMAHAVGPVADPKGMYGMAVLELEDHVDPRVVGGDDPVVKAGVGFTIEVLPILSLITPKSVASA